ncbi:sensor histidine kinase [Bradyrhizobium sp. HKCCYLS20291]|uniref:sensor histidine kinase n=1 Tax=Bradyrhizobium sp. HKCCYLS20291 TaxID=3420766 RepID=UPI003EBFFCDE
MKNRRTLLLGILGLQALLAAFAYKAADDASLRAARVRANERLSILSDTLHDTIDRFSGIPDLASAGSPVIAVLQDPASQPLVAAANTFLERAAKGVGAAALFLLDDRGIAIAASNWRDAGSFVGHDYSFRPYFHEAMSSGRGQYYGVGVTTGLPGYFMSSRIARPLDEKPAGVLVVKIDFSELEESWAKGSETVLVTDQDGVVFLTNDKLVKYRPVQPLPSDARARLDGERRYATNPIGAVIEAKLLDADLSASGPIASTSWRMITIIPSDGRRLQPVAAAAIVFTTGLALWLSLIVLWQRRARVLAERHALVVLESTVAERTAALASALGRLEQEVEERRRTDAELHRARDELVQTAKLAAMGEAFSGLAHEVNQPLAALRTYVSATRLLLERNDLASATANLSVMDRAIQKLSGLTANLKRLARQDDRKFETIDLGVCVGQVLELLKFRLVDEHVEIEFEPLSRAWMFGDAARIEQVVLNLLQNAIDAVSGQADRLIVIAVETLDEQVVLIVGDRGPGVPAAASGRLFDPFFTTKEPGRGLGLGLSIAYSIVKEHGGSIQYERSDAGETRFRAVFPRAKGAERNIA